MKTEFLMKNTNKKIIEICYYVIAIICIIFYGVKYSDSHPLSKFYIILFFTLILGWVSKKLKRHLVNTNLFFLIIILLSLISFKEFYELLSKLSELILLVINF